MKEQEAGGTKRKVLELEKGGSQPHPVGDLFRFLLMPLASAQHPALKATISSVKLGCFNASNWSLGQVSPVDVGVYWCSSCLLVVVCWLKVPPETIPLLEIMYQ